MGSAVTVDAMKGGAMKGSAVKVRASVASGEEPHKTPATGHTFGQKDVQQHCAVGR